MSIFNSLGSNYDLSFALSALSAGSRKGESEKLKKLLGERYNGKALLTYKGREALRMALRIIDKPKDHTVGICGFTCFAVYEAVIKEGYDVEYLDIEKDSLNFSLKALTDAVKKNPKLKILFIQNTLGYPCDIEMISKFCKEKNIILVEDLAHSIGMKYEDGREAGTVGDFVALSFSQDKMIDGVSGGALIVRNSELKINNSEFHEISLKQQLRDRLYPLFTFKIRKTYGLGLGKILHLVLKKANLLSKPVEDSDSQNLHQLPNWYCKLIYDEFKNLNNNINHRKNIVKIYFHTLNKKLFFEKFNIDISSNLRFPIFIKNRKGLIAYLKKYNIFVSDIWYDAPIAPRKYLQKTNYKNGQCPNAENISEVILNLPTHINVSENDAKFIADKINLWLKSQ